MPNYLEVLAKTVLLVGISPQVPTVPATNAAAVVVKCDSELCGHFYVDGKLFKSLSSTNALVSVSLSDTGKYMRADVSVTNLSGSAIDVLPEKFALQSVSPDNKALKYLVPEKMVSSAKSHQAWGNALASMGSAMQTKQTTTQSNTSGNVNVNGSNGTSANGTYNDTTTSTTSSPDYAAQQRTRERIRERQLALEAASSDMLSSSLRANTLSQGATQIGRVYFERTKHHKEMVLSILLSGTIYEFPFTFDK